MCLCGSFLKKFFGLWRKYLNDKFFVYKQKKKSLIDKI